MSHFPEDLFDSPPDGEGIGEIVPVQAELGQANRQLSIEERRAEKLRSIEEDLLEDNLTILRDVGKFRDIDPAANEPPYEWVSELGEVEAVRRFRVAKAAWMSAKEAPVALAIAKSITVGIVRARATERAAPKSLNIALVQMTAPPKLYEEKEIE